MSASVWWMRKRQLFIAQHVSTCQKGDNSTTLVHSGEEGRDEKGKGKGKEEVKVVDPGTAFKAGHNLNSKHFLSFLSGARRARERF